MPYKIAKGHLLVDQEIFDVIQDEHDETKIPKWKIVEDICKSSKHFAKLKRKWG